MEILEAVKIIEYAKNNITMCITLTEEVDEALEVLLNYVKRKTKDNNY